MKLIDIINLGIYDDEIKSYIEKQIANSLDTIVVSKESYLKFPTVGNSKSIYIDTTENKIYRWDDTELKYYTVGSNYGDIKIINGNF